MSVFVNGILVYILPTIKANVGAVLSANGNQSSRYQTELAFVRHHSFCFQAKIVRIVFVFLQVSQFLPPQSCETDWSIAN